MRIVIVYKKESDYYREVVDYLRDFKHQTGEDLDEIDPYSRDGSNFCRTYDVVEYPTILALDSSGVVQKTWRGRPLPQIDQVSYYLR